MGRLYHMTIVYRTKRRAGCKGSLCTCISRLVTKLLLIALTEANLWILMQAQIANSDVAAG